MELAGGVQSLLCGRWEPGSLGDGEVEVGESADMSNKKMLGGKWQLSDGGSRVSSLLFQSQKHLDSVLVLATEWMVHFERDAMSSVGELVALWK